MLQCIIVDDEQLALDLLEDYISNIPYLELIGQCKNALEATKIMQEKMADLIFIDIMMPGISGLQFIQSMPNRPMIIMVTAYAEYALEGFNLEVIDYLVKPVSLDRFTKACSKAWEYYQLKNNFKAGKKSAHPGYFFVNSDYSLIKINLENVVWIEGMKDYIKIYLNNSSKPVITLMNMKDIEELLPASQFVRIHKSYIAGIKYITAIRKNSVFIDALELPVGNNYKNALELIVRGGGHSPNAS
ncbi:MAG: LytR/AlgR family response regulator transcription factor [Chitinophagaceae bacterium]